jgi:hypothetical protein
MRRRHLSEVDDGSSPFARDRFSLLPPEEQEAVIAKRRAQRIAAEALDSQLASRSGTSTGSGSGGSPKRPARQSPRNDTSLPPAPLQEPREPPLAQPRLDSHPAALRSPERAGDARRSQPQTDVPDAQVAWWHEPEARRRSPPPRRRSGRELLRDPEESLLREAERLKKLEVGEALRAQIQERERHRAGLSPDQQPASPPRALLRTVDVVETAVRVVSPDDQSVEVVPADRALRQSEGHEPARAATETQSADRTWQDTSVLHDRLARLEFQLGWSQAGQRSPTGSVDIGVLAQELRAEMAAIHDAHRILNDDLDSQLQFLAHLDQSVKSLQAKAPLGMHDATDGSTNHATQVVTSLRHDVDQLLAKRSKTTNATADLDDRLASMVDELRHELAEDMSAARHNTTDRDDVVPLIERLSRVQEKQSNDHLLLAEQVAQLESVVAQQAGTRIPAQVSPRANDGNDHPRRQSISVEGDTSSVEELRQEMGRRFELSTAALDEVSRRQSAVAEEFASMHSSTLSKEDAKIIVRDLSTIGDRVEALEQIRDDNPSLSEVSDKLNELVEKQWELDQSDTLQALEDSVHTCIQETAATTSKLQAQSSAVAESIALSQDLSAISRRVDVLEQGREGDLAQLFEKLNGVEEKSWDEQALLAEQITALEAKLAVTPGGGGS